jgi:hypothetical protein
MTKVKSALALRKNDSCKKITDLICNYLAGRLSPAVKREFERHLKNVPRLCQFFEHL